MYKKYEYLYTQFIVNKIKTKATIKLNYYVQN